MVLIVYKIHSHPFSHLILTTTLWGRHEHPYFTDEQTEKLTNLLKVVQLGRSRDGSECRFSDPKFSSSNFSTWAGGWEFFRGDWGHGIHHGTGGKGGGEDLKVKLLSSLLPLYPFPSLASLFPKRISECNLTLRMSWFEMSLWIRRKYVRWR